MDFLLTYRPDTEVGLIKDPAFAEVMNVCGITSNRRNAQIGYVAVSTVAGLSSIGFYTSVQNSVYIRCPVSQDAIEQIQNDPLAKTDPVTVEYCGVFVPTLFQGPLASLTSSKLAHHVNRSSRGSLATGPW
ncbi:hypothetical protein DFJ73DRAFT_822312 [Zopfochytrium polystomum]|nr:hypothetical protein DFJ73DRAFT_822312 [Zopfochytrium polystomum]